MRSGPSTTAPPGASTVRRRAGGPGRGRVTAQGLGRAVDGVAWGPRAPGHRDTVDDGGRGRAQERRRGGPSRRGGHRARRPCRDELPTVRRPRARARRALRLGAIVVPVNTCARTERAGQRVERGAAEARCARRPALARSSELPSFTDGLPTNGASPVLDASGPDDPAMLMFTSARPVGRRAILSHGKRARERKVCAPRAMDSRRPTRAHAAALPHARSRRGRARHVAHGASMAIARSAPMACSTSGAEKATLFFGVPTMYVRLVAARARRARIAAPLRVRVGRARCRCVAALASAAASASSSATA